MSLIDFTPFISLAVFGLAVTPAGLLGEGKARRTIAPSISMIGLFLALGSAIWLGFSAAQTPGPGAIMSTDIFTYFFTGVLLVVAIFVGVASLSFMRGDPNEAPYLGF